MRMIMTNVILSKDHHHTEGVTKYMLILWFFKAKKVYSYKSTAITVSCTLHYLQIIFIFSDANLTVALLFYSWSSKCKWGWVNKLSSHLTTTNNVSQHHIIEKVHACYQLVINKLALNHIKEGSSIDKNVNQV